MDAVPAGDAAGPQRRRLGQPADLDGACRGDARRHPSLQRDVCARRRRTGRRRRRSRFAPGSMPGRCAGSTECRRPTPSRRSTLKASGADFSYALTLDADRPLVLQGDAGYSKKSERGQASYYYSQPFFKATGTLTIDDKPVDVTGQAWMDREWSSQPLASDQTGWDWFVAASRLRREADAVSAAAEATASITSPATGSRRRQARRRIAARRHQHDAEGHRPRSTAASCRPHGRSRFRRAHCRSNARR